MKHQLLLLTVFLVLGCSHGWSLVLVDAGRALTPIVVREGADRQEELAAAELSAYVRKSTGVSLPVVAAPTPGLAHILIGAGAGQLGKDLALADLTYGGFVIQCDDKRLVLAGKEPEGTLNAVYCFLEDCLGVRWFMPTELGENVPATRRIDIPAMTRRVEPRFVCRRNHGIDSSVPEGGDLWRRRVRITSHSLDVPFNRYSHNLCSIFRAERYGKDHPEYYSLLRGRRHIPTSRADHRWQPCTTNPEVVDATVAAARNWHRTRPLSNFFSVGMNDSAAFCTCRACLSLDQPGETFRGRAMVSHRYFTFVRQVAEETLKTHPDKYITCIAYSVVESPPAGVDLPRNVGVVITQDAGQWHDPEYRRKDMEFAQAWAAKAGAFGTYNYTSLGWFLPRVYPHLMAESLRFYDRLGAVAVTNESWPSFWYCGPQLYLRAKMMWDPGLNCDTVLDEYYHGFFGPAADPMKRLYTVFEHCMTKPRPGRWFGGISSVPDQIALWSPQDLDACRAALQNARTAAVDKRPFADRVDLVRRGFAYVEAIIREYWQAQRLRDATSAAAPDVEKLLDALREFAARARTRRGQWDDIKGEPLIAGNYLRIKRERASRLNSWHAHLDSSAAQAMSVLMQNADRLSAERLSACIASLDSPGLSRKLRAMRWVRRHPDAENLLRNAGFEETKGDARAPQGVDWVSSDAPPGWSKWALEPGNVSRLRWRADGGRTGSRCVSHEGVKNACFIQAIPVKPGQVYAASAWARTEGSPEASVGLYIQWQDAKGAWASPAPRRLTEVAGGKSDWRRIVNIYVIPEGVARAVHLLRARNQAPGDLAVFDDVRVVRIPPE